MPRFRHEPPKLLPPLRVPRSGGRGSVFLVSFFCWKFRICFAFCNTNSSFRRTKTQEQKTGSMHMQSIILSLFSGGKNRGFNTSKQPQLAQVRPTFLVVVKLGVFHRLIQKQVRNSHKRWSSNKPRKYNAINPNWFRSEKMLLLLVNLSFLTFPKPARASPNKANRSPNRLGSNLLDSCFRGGCSQNAGGAPKTQVAWLDWPVPPHSRGSFPILSRHPSF